jgi:peptidoglycan/xylan/chitin deacetylase (PgdA/CDA1 family)
MRFSYKSSQGKAEVMLNRRNFVLAGGASVLASSMPLTSELHGQAVLPATQPDGAFWPDGARLVISISMQMEAGAEPSSGTESPMPRIDSKYPDLPATKWYDYGFKEGIPRLLDMFDRRNVKVTSHMVGAAVEMHPELAKEIVQRARSVRPRSDMDTTVLYDTRRRAEGLRRVDRYD